MCVCNDTFLFSVIKVFLFVGSRSRKRKEQSYDYVCLHFRFFSRPDMELFSFLPVSLDFTTSIAISVLTLLGVYWFWLKPRGTQTTRNDVFIRPIQPLKEYILVDFVSTEKSSILSSRDNNAGRATGNGHEGSFIDRMIHSEKTMVVFYGSQTGTAEDFAQRIAKQAKRYGISATVCDPEECDMVCE